MLPVFTVLASNRGGVREGAETHGRKETKEAASSSVALDRLSHVLKLHSNCTVNLLIKSNTREKQ